MPRRSTAAASTHKVIEGLLPLLTPVAEVQQDPENARVHNARNIESIASSLRRFGQRKPVVANRQTRVVLAGNGTLVAALAEGWTHLAVVWVDDDPGTAAGYALADNRTAELAEWDFQRLGAIVRALKEQDETLIVGWSADELSPVMEAEWRPPSEGEMPRAGGGAHYTCSVEQKETIDRAIAKVRESEGDAEIPDGRCLEFISADFIAGN